MSAFIGFLLWVGAKVAAYGLAASHWGWPGLAVVAVVEQLASRLLFNWYAETGRICEMAKCSRRSTTLLAPPRRRS